MPISGRTGRFYSALGFTARMRDSLVNALGVVSHGSR